MTPAPRADTFAGPARGRPLRIALVIERFAPGTGGVENVAWRVAHELARGGLDVSVLAREVAAEAAVDAIAAIQNGLPDARWITPESLHLTLSGRFARH